MQQSCSALCDRLSLIMCLQVYFHTTSFPNTSFGRTSLLLQLYNWLPKKGDDIVRKMKLVKQTLDTELAFAKDLATFTSKEHPSKKRKVDGEESTGKRFDAAGYTHVRAIGLSSMVCASA